MSEFQYTVRESPFNFKPLVFSLHNKKEVLLADLDLNLQVVLVADLVFLQQIKMHFRANTLVLGKNLT